MVYRPFIALFCLLTPVLAEAQISKGFEILLKRGFQLEGMVSHTDPFHIETYTNANYSTVNLFWDPAPSYLGTAPGYPWTRWARNPSEMPPLAGEAPYLNQLVTLQLGDEWYLDDNSRRTELVDWFNAVRTNWPNTILFHNNFGGQITDATLADYIARAQPDMLCFDSYPYRYDEGSGISSSTIYQWYGDLRRWRQFAKDYNLPLATYLQTFVSFGEGVRAPSASELRLQHSIAMAFNCKVLIDFTYNSGASSLFTNAYGGDNAPNWMYYEKADCGKRAMNFGKALVRLKPVADDLYFYVEGRDKRTTSITQIRGKDANGNPNPFPIGFGADWEGGVEYTEWAPGRNDPYLIDWTVTNVGTKNNGQRGDVFLSWFEPLDESLDGPEFNNERYVMVVNGLTDMTGTAADCAQEIRLNFNTSLTAIEMLNPLTGLAEVKRLPLTNGVRQLVLNLNGGDAALFKFSDGAPFLGTSLTSKPFLYEPFDYSNIGGPVSSNTPPNWTNNVAAGVTNDCLVTAGNLSFTGLAASVGNSVTNGGVGLGIRRFLGTNINSGTIHLSALFRINDLGYGTGGWTGASAQAGGLCATDNSSFRLQIMVKSNSPSGYLIGVQKGGTGASATFDTTERHANETVFLVGKYDFEASPNTVTLWINPSPSAFLTSVAPTNGIIWTNSGTDGFAIDRFNMRQNTATTVPAAMQWDELRFGSSWADVTPTAAPVITQLTNTAKLNGGQFQFTCTNSNGKPGVVYTSTNLFYWTPLGSPTQVSAGVYQFTDTTASNHIRRYYQLRTQ